MVITADDRYKNIDFDLYLNGEKVKYCQMVDTNKNLIQVFKTNPDNPELLLINKNSNGESCVITEEIYGDFRNGGNFELRATLYEDGFYKTDGKLKWFDRGEIKEIITDLKQIESIIMTAERIED